MTSADEGGSTQEKVAAAARGITQFETTTFRTLGIGAWLALGIAGVLALALYLIALVADVAIPLAIAAVLAAILVPLADRLERWHFPRWLGATLVLIFALSLVVATGALIVGAITNQSDEIWAKLEASLQQVDDSSSLFEGASEDLIGVAHELVRVLTSGSPLAVLQLREQLRRRDRPRHLHAAVPAEGLGPDHPMDRRPSRRCPLR